MKHKSPVGLGYLPKGGRPAGQKRNAAWAVEQEAAMAERSAAPGQPVAAAVTADGAQVRASAPDATADGAPYDGLLGGVERWCYAGAGAVAGVLFTLTATVR